MANVVRRPFADISIDGHIEPRIMSARVSKGLNQNYTTAELVMPYPYPSGLRTWSNVSIIAGGDRSSAGAGLHFSGHMLDPSLNMWPPRGTMLCGSQLARLENWMPPVSLTLNGLTDVQAIELIFNTVGIYDRHIEGHGKRLGDLATQALTWAPPVDALSMVQQIDEQFGLGYRTFDTGTTVVRRFIPLSPVSMPHVYTFEEGVNCINGGFNKRRVAPAGTVVVNGDGVSATAESPTSNFTPTPYAINFIMIQQQALDAGIVSAEEMATYLLARLTRSLVTATVTTWEDRIFSPGQVVRYKAAHLLLEQNFFVQQVITSFEGARFRQQLELISELDERTTPSGFVPLGTIDPGTMDPLDPLEPLDPLDFPDVEPPASSITASMVIVAIDREKVVISGAETEVFIVYAVDTSSAFTDTVSARAWTATGPVLSGWESGTGREFVAAFTSLTGAAIELEITMTGGATASVTRNLETSPGVPTKTLELFLAAGVNAEAWSPSGNAWNVDAQSAAADVEDVANGPFWSLPVTTANGMWSTDYLATSATEETIPFTDSSTAGIRCWIEPDVNDQLVAVIGSNGQLALSSNRGDTWTVKAGPGGAGRDVIVSRFVPGQIHVLTATGYYVSDNNGDSWRTIRADTDFKWLTLSHTRNMIVTTGGVLETAEGGTAQTGPGAVVVTAAAHIREDRFIALTSDGHVWRTTTAGGNAMSDLGVITGTPVHSYRHGSIPDFYAYAAGTSGAFKLIVRVNAGPTYEVKILQIRSPGVGNSDASASYSRIGVGRMADALLSGVGLLIHTSEDEGVQIRKANGTWIRPTTTEGATDTDIKSGWIFAATIARDNADRMYAGSIDDSPTYPSGRIYTSADGGVTWTTMTAPTNAFASVLVSPQDGHVYASTTAVEKSTNNGSSWSTIVPGASIGGDPTGIAVGTTRLWIIGNAGGASGNVYYCALDGSGLTEVPGSSGTAASNQISAPSDTLAVVCKALATTGARVHKYTTSGTTDITPSGLGTQATWDVQALSDTVFLLLTNTGAGASQVNRIWRTDDAGTSWSVVFTYPTGEGPSRFGAIDYKHLVSRFGDADVVFANGHGGSTYQHRIYRSTDGGATWGAAILNEQDPPDGGGGWLLFGPGGLVM